MNISILGLGYVGCVTAGCLARDGHEVIGVDINAAKVERFASGQPTVIEPGLDELFAEGHKDGLITATTDFEAAVHATRASIICVGTPNNADGSLDLSAVRQTSQAIGRALRTKPARHVVINRSTVPAGTAETLVRPALVGMSGKDRGEFGLFVVPEFLREANAITDFYDPPFVVAGSAAPAEPDPDADVVQELFGAVVERVQWTTYREAEMLKALCNAFHALKVAFANEVGALCSSLSLDGRAIMQLLVRDRKLNISTAYLRPGLPFGGSCLPKDLRMILNLAHQAHLDLPLLNGVMEGNEAHIQRALARITGAGCRRIGLDGLSFKTGTDDLRESPIVLIAEHLIGKGYELKIFDPDVVLSCLMGANRKYIQDHLPHLSSRLVPTPADLIENSEAIVYTRESSEVRTLMESLSRAPKVIDLTDKTRPGSKPRAAGKRAARKQVSGAVS
jgi:GDP-mannose 6-dehydrogenase